MMPAQLHIPAQMGLFNDTLHRHCPRRPLKIIQGRPIITLLPGCQIHSNTTFRVVARPVLGESDIRMQVEVFAEFQGYGWVVVTSGDFLVDYVNAVFEYDGWKSVGVIPTLWMVGAQVFVGSNDSGSGGDSRGPWMYGKDKWQGDDLH